MKRIRTLFVIGLVLMTIVGGLSFYLSNREQTQNNRYLEMWGLKQADTELLLDYYQREVAFDGWAVNCLKYKLDSDYVVTAIDHLDNNFSVVTKRNNGEILPFVETVLLKVKGDPVLNDLRQSKDKEYWIYRNADNSSRILVFVMRDREEMTIVFEQNPS